VVGGAGPGVPYNGFGPPNGVINGAPPAEARRFYGQSQQNVARLDVRVPEEAKVYLQDQPMTLNGPVRRFVSPTLEPGRDYVYTIRIEVQRNGQTISETRQARVRAGQQVNVAAAFNRTDPNQLVTSIRPQTVR
jgi:uncharacterized protein (TIGR03000 family)